MQIGAIFQAAKGQQQLQANIWAIKYSATEYNAPQSHEKLFPEKEREIGINIKMILLWSYK